MNGEDSEWCAEWRQLFCDARPWETVCGGDGRDPSSISPEVTHPPEVPEERPEYHYKREEPIEIKDFCNDFEYKTSEWNVCVDQIKAYCEKHHIQEYCLYDPEEWHSEE